eukprot:Awhi_evm1s3785
MTSIPTPTPTTIIEESITSIRQRPWRIGLLSIMGMAYDVIKASIEECTQKHKLVVVLSCKGPKSRASDAYLDVVKKAQNDGIDVIVCNQPDFHHELLKAYNLDIVLSFGFPWLIRESVINLPPLGCYNFHNSLLPKLKGPNALGWNLMNNDGYMGLCLHKVDTTFDTGDVLFMDK